MKKWPSRTFPVGIFAVFICCFGYFYFFNQFWTHVATRRFQALSEYQSFCFQAHRGRQILVHREFLPILARLGDYAASHCLKLLITGSFRRPDRKISNTIVTPAVRSNHLAGHAIDFNVIFDGRAYESEDLGRAACHKLPDPVRRFIEDIRQDGAMRWGGDFETEDPVHVDDALNVRQPEVWDMHYRAAAADYGHAERKWVAWIRDLFS